MDVYINRQALLVRFAFNELHGRQSTDGLRRGEYKPQMLR